MTAIEDLARSVFFAALERAPDQWAAFLDEACGDHAELRTRVEQLLQAHQALGSIHGGANAPAATLDGPVPEAPGTVIGPYKLIEPIGEGGMGSVWMAQQTEPVKRLVALKLIKAGMDSKQVIARFEAERQALALMDHPNIARVLDGGTTAQGRPYFVMDLVKGVPITKYCDEHHLPPRQRLELFVPVCQAIQHAHQKGIIHRDLKPSNVLVAPYDGKPVVKVIDFGVAKAAGQPLTDKTLVTGFGAIVGTLEYMSPEQAELNNHDIDTRSDIYSLGVLLYELLTGSPPFSRKELEKAGMLEMLRVIREEEPSKPSTKLSTAEGLPTLAANRGTEPAKLTRLVRGELDWIVMKALEKDRNRRYETANGFAADVQRYLADEQVLACPPSVGYRFRKFARRNKASLAFAGLVLLILFTVTGGIGWNVRDRAARQAAAEHEVNRALKDAEAWQEQGNWPEALSAAKRAEGLLAGGVRDELRERVHQLRKDLDMVLRLDEIRLLSSDKFDFESADQAYAQAFIDYGIDVARLPADEAAARIRGRPGVTVALVTALDDWASRRSRKNKAGSSALTAVAQAADPDPWRRQVREAHKQNDARALAALAASLELLRQPPTTLVFLAEAVGEERGIELLRSAQRQYPGDFWINLQLAMRLGDLAPPYRNERVAFIRAALATRPQSIGARNLLGFYLDHQGKRDEAVDTYRRALELDPRFTVVRIHLGHALLLQGKGDEALGEYRKASELDPKSAFAHLVLGHALVDRKRMDEAIDAYRKAIEIDPTSAWTFSKLGNEFHEQKKLDAVAHIVLGNALVERKRMDEAIGAYRKAIELDPTSAGAFSEFGNALYKQNKLEDAMAALHKAIELDPKLAAAHVNLGNVLHRQKKLDEATAEYRKAIEIDPKLAAPHYNLGNILREQKTLDEAVAEYREAIRLDPYYAKASYHLGRVLQEQRKPDEAIAAYREAIKSDWGLADAYYSLGTILTDQRKLNEAIDVFREAIRLDPKDASAHNSLGVALYYQQKLNEAIDEYRKAIGIDPNSAPAHNNLGLALQKLGRPDEAIDALRRAIEIDPEYASARKSLGDFLAMKGWNLANNPDPKLRDPRRAVELAKEAVGFAPQSVNAWQYLGWAQYRAGNCKDSIEALEKSCRLQEGGAGDCYQWIVLALAHAQLAADEGLPDEERVRHRAEARRWYEPSARDLDGKKWTTRPTGVLDQAAYDFRQEALKLIDPKEGK